MVGILPRLQTDPFFHLGKYGKEPAAVRIIKLLRRDKHIPEIRPCAMHQPLKRRIICRITFFYHLSRRIQCLFVMIGAKTVIVGVIECNLLRRNQIVL